jgi:hypothetical protein
MHEFDNLKQGGSQALQACQVSSQGCQGFETGNPLATPFLRVFKKRRGDLLIHLLFFQKAFSRFSCSINIPYILGFMKNLVNSPLGIRLGTAQQLPLQDCLL